MSKLEELINKLCPNGVEFKKLIEITTWDKKFNGIDNSYKKIFKHISAEQLKKFNSDSGNIKLLSTGIFDGYAEEEKCKEFINEGDVLTLPSGGTANIKYFSGKFLDSGNIIAITRDEKKYNIKYIYYNLINIQSLIQSFYRGSGVKHPDMANILNINIPVPPLEVQCEIVRILDNFTLLSAELSAELSARQKQYVYYAEKLLFNNEYEKVKLGDLCVVNQGLQIPINQRKKEPGQNRYFYITVQFLKGGDENYYIENPQRNVICNKEDILVTRTGSTGKIITGVEGCFHNNFFKVEPNEKVLKRYLYFVLNSKTMYNKMLSAASGGTVPDLPHKKFYNLEIFLPNIEEQKRIINILEKLYKISNDISNGLPAEIEARKKQYEYYRDKLLTFKELKS
ncbi:restriction endonuclease subunit S [uncultured Campylobacter sp.]|uniref:restriction endonuclease subunit S n=1 Tax=uncultured Campylobacter sp. TaxID=218934 RepID=UPI0025E47F31|nr:restriction endonuclease subunit S [uncultured Campylobacter sp.]